MLSISKKIPKSKSIEIKIPTLTKTRFMVIDSIEILQSTDLEKWEPAKDLDIRIKSGNNEIRYISYGLLNISNIIDFKDKLYDMVGLTNLILHVKRNNNNEQIYIYKFNMNFVHTFGNLQYQYSYDINTVDKIFSDIVNNCVCTRLILGFNMPVSKIELEPQYDSENYHWLDSLELQETDSDNCYTIDFTNESFVEYSKYLDFINIKLPENISKDIKIFVLAYGWGI